MLFTSLLSSLALAACVPQESPGSRAPRTGYSRSYREEHYARAPVHHYPRYFSPSPRYYYPRTRGLRHERDAYAWPRERYYTFPRGMQPH